ncbi:kinesin heavy chain-like isoform X1, partial [Clarias magur]
MAGRSLTALALRWKLYSSVRIKAWLIFEDLCIRRDMGPEDSHNMEKTRTSKSFRVVLCLCSPEHTEMRTETKASIRVIGTNRVTVDTGR